MMYRILWGENAPKSDQKTVFQERTQPTLRVREQRRGAKGQRAMEWEKRCQMLPAANDLALILAEPPRETTGAQRWVGGWVGVWLRRFATGSYKCYNFSQDFYNRENLVHFRDAHGQGATAWLSAHPSPASPHTLRFPEGQMLCRKSAQVHGSRVL